MELDGVTALTPWFEGTTTAINGIALAAFDRALSAVQPVTIDGPPIQWLTTVSADQYSVLLSNNSDEVWEGTLTARRVDGSYTICRELLSGRTSVLSMSNGGAAVVARAGLRRRRDQLEKRLKEVSCGEDASSLEDVWRELEC